MLVIFLSRVSDARARRTLVRYRRCTGGGRRGEGVADREEEDEQVSILSVPSPRHRRRRAATEHEIRSPPSYVPPNVSGPVTFRTDRKREAHGESRPRRDSGHVRGIYSRGGRSRMCRPCSSPSEFPGLVSRGLGLGLAICGLRRVSFRPSNLDASP